MRYELADYEWIAIKPMLPNKPRGVPNERHVLNGIFCKDRKRGPKRLRRHRSGSFDWYADRN
jgi:transposase